MKGLFYFVLSKASITANWNAEIIAISKKNVSKIGTKVSFQTE